MVSRLCYVQALFVCLILLAPAYAQSNRSRTLKYEANTGKWREEPPPPIGTPDGDLYALRLDVREGEYRRALSKVEQWEERYTEADPRYAELMLAKAQARIGLRDFYKAHELLLGFLNAYYDAELTREALRLEMHIAETYLTGIKRKWLGMRILDAEDIAFAILDDISINYPETEYAPAAIKTKADYLFKGGEYELAQIEYERLLRNYPANRYHRFALRRSADAALATYAGIDYDNSPILESEERFEEYRFRYPNEASREGVGLIVESIRVQRAEKEFETGQYYERTDHLRSAIYYYKLTVENWPDTRAAILAGERLALLGAAEDLSADQRGEQPAGESESKENGNPGGGE